mgnify:CR=1 FL=1
MWQWNTSWCSNTFESKHCPLNILSISSFSSWKRLSGAGSLSFIYLIAFQLTNEGSVLIHLCFNLWAQSFIILTKIIVKIWMETICTYKLFARQFTLKWNVTSGNNWLGVQLLFPCHFITLHSLLRYGNSLSKPFS